MNKIMRNLKSFSGALLVLALMLMALFFLLSKGAQSRIPVVSQVSQFGERYTNPASYSTIGAGI